MNDVTHLDDEVRLRAADELARLAGGAPDTLRMGIVTAGEAREQDPARRSWRPIDLLALADTPPEQPSIGGLLYRGARHVFSGEPESGKTSSPEGATVTASGHNARVSAFDVERHRRERAARLEREVASLRAERARLERLLATVLLLAVAGTPCPPLALLGVLAQEREPVDVLQVLRDTAPERIGRAA